MAKSKIIIADDQPLIRDGLAAILSMEDDYSVVAKTGDGVKTIELAKTHNPHLILMDIHMPKLDGLEATKQIIAANPDTKVLILTTFEDEEYIWEAMRNGASGFLVKGAATERILSTVRECLEGRINFPSSIQMRLVQALQPSERAGKHSGHEIPKSNDHIQEGKHPFTIQERNILRLVKLGLSNHAIAAELLLSKGTIKNYLGSIYKKLNVSSKAEAIAYLHTNDPNSNLPSND